MQIQDSAWKVVLKVPLKMHNEPKTFSIVVSQPNHHGQQEYFLMQGEKEVGTAGFRSSVKTEAPHGIKVPMPKKPHETSHIRDWMGGHQPPMDNVQFQNWQRSGLQNFLYRNLVLSSTKGQNVMHLRLSISSNLSNNRNLN